MSELIVIGYGSEADAEAARQEVYEMRREYLVELSDAVVATSDEHGKVRLNQMVNMWSLGAANGAFWGLLIGLIFVNPILGVAVGAGAGALTGALADYGINDNFMKEVAEVLQPGQAALFMMVKGTASDKVIARLSEAGGRIIRTNLDTTREAALREAFDHAHQGVIEENQKGTS